MLVLGIGQLPLCGTCRENLHGAVGHWHMCLLHGHDLLCVLDCHALEPMLGHIAFGSAGACPKCQHWLGRRWQMRQCPGLIGLQTQCASMKGWFGSGTVSMASSRRGCPCVRLQCQRKLSWALPRSRPQGQWHWPQRPCRGSSQSPQHPWRGSSHSPQHPWRRKGNCLQTHL